MTKLVVAFRNFTNAFYKLTQAQKFLCKIFHSPHTSRLVFPSTVLSVPCPYSSIFNPGNKPRQCLFPVPLSNEMIVEKTVNSCSRRSVLTPEVLLTDSQSILTVFFATTFVIFKNNERCYCPKKLNY